ncbi:hypothetical protein [Bacillus sp. EB600]|uniref:hypothetical protein n=1 Tax=Bacillus sp. EB600 TaxID=2806345 RepID=UPI00210BC247|nr:hypothetical protein [Bacillus sp. EB600]MCQ6279660.1 hypothetical protein [Bacillus sp. EB600]
MKMNRVFTTFVSILMIFVIVGCSNSGNPGKTAAGSRGYPKPDVFGEVSAIGGNKVTLKLLKVPQMSGRNGQVRGTGDGNMGVNAAGNNGRFASGSGGPGKGGMRPRNYTGETKTIVIPKGVSITTMTRGTNGMNQTNISLNDLTTGSTLSIYYDTDGKTIKSIRVQKPRTVNGQAGNSGS